MFTIKALKLINKILIGLIVVITFFFAVGIAYSYFAANILGAETTTTITAEAGYMTITYEGSPNINATGFAPSTVPFATKTFTLKGTRTLASADMGYKIILVIDENTFTNNAISYTLTSTNLGGNGTIAPSITIRENIMTNNITLGTGQFSGIITNSTHSYELDLYFYDTGEDQTIDMEKTFKAHIGIEKYNPCVAGNCLKDKILAQGGGVAAIVSRGTPDFNVINGTSGIYASADEYGTSYYYRGLKTELNNNIIWAGFQWKIIRINGDGSIRLIYNGTEAEFITNGTMNTTGTNTQIGTSTFNSNSNDAKYVGYMYGGANGVASTMRNGTTSSAATYNQTSNTIKGVLDNWYQTNIAGKPAESQVVNNLFCNDRQLQNEVGGAATGPGYGNTGVFTYYAPYYRLNTNKTPTLRCGQKNDRFTTSNDTTLGNGALTYPIGLLTADEAAMAGLVYGTPNSTNYLYTNQTWWSSSPGSMNSSGIANVCYVASSGDIYNSNVNNTRGVRPGVSINLSAIVTGTGSATDPFRVV